MNGHSGEWARLSKPGGMELYATFPKSAAVIDPEPELVEANISSQYGRPRPGSPAWRSGTDHLPSESGFNLAIIYQREG